MALSAIASSEFDFWYVPVAPDMHDMEVLPHPKVHIHGELMLQLRWPEDIYIWLKLGHLNI